MVPHTQWTKIYCVPDLPPLVRTDHVTMCSNDTFKRVKNMNSYSCRRITKFLYEVVFPTGVKNILKYTPSDSCRGFIDSVMKGLSNTRRSRISHIVRVIYHIQMNAPSNLL